MNAPFGAPLDPVFIAFREGLANAFEDLIFDSKRLRWSPDHGKWFTYSIQGFILEDVGKPDTSLTFGVQMVRDRITTDTLYVPDQFARVQEAYAQDKKKWPALVWSVTGSGDWRNVIKRVPGNSPPPPPPAAPVLPKECLQRINDVRAYQANGFITAAQAQKMINQIVADCTGGA